MGKTQIQTTSNRRDEDSEMASSNINAPSKDVCALGAAKFEANGWKIGAV